MALSDTNRRQSSNFLELVGDNENDKSTESSLTDVRVEPNVTYPNQNPSSAVASFLTVTGRLLTNRVMYSSSSTVTALAIVIIFLSESR